ncbi:MAG: chemotaxis response regulator protein-glutamate methylesterase [Alphaproteobacteria bacterium]|nr:chemotaxis response regulator protein-glutamate methylesterase [Alphaproteobacteria bacterium]
MHKKIKVLVCDDSALIRKILGTFIQSADDMEFLGTAEDPFDAREKIKRLNPDVLTLDIEMPKMDGLTFLEKIMTLRPMPVIMVSTLTQQGASATLQALETGAFDYLGKPNATLTGAGLDGFREELLHKIRVAAQSRMVERHQLRQTAAPISLNYRPPAASHVDIIAFGASTGGVEALRETFTRLPAGLPPIVITQHMPRAFTESFAKRLDSVSAVQVSQAEHGERLQPGHGYLAPGGSHLSVVRKGGLYYADVREGEAVSGHCPSVDVLFGSVAETAGSRSIGAIFTGMGRDGAQGLLAMREAGAFTLGQNEATCVVYGMPKAAFQLGGVIEQQPLSHIAARVVAVCQQKEAAHERA